MLATMDVRKFLSPLLMLTVPGLLGVPQVTPPHRPATQPSLPPPPQASQEQAHSEVMVGASSGGRDLGPIT